MNKTMYSKMGFVFGVALLGVLTGCVGYDDRPHHTRGYYRSPPPVHVETAVVVHDGYVYYPSHQVYYSRTRHHYVYLEGRSWVTRPSPPRVSVDVLFASPSVRLDFHDSPSAHHSKVVRQYPKHWSPPGHQKEHPGRGNAKGNDWKGRK